MTRKVFASLLIACLPWLAMAQSNNDLYYIPKKQKKEVKKEVKADTRQVEQPANTTTVYTAPVTNVVVKDVKGNVRDVDEYNRRSFTSRDNTFKVEDETLIVQEKPYNERGEWVNGFEGSEMDYENAMRIIRFHNPRYAIPVSSPLYWDVVYGLYPSWEWNVFDDGMYAYVFPTYSNRLYFDFSFSFGWYGPGWGAGWGWGNPWYNPWYGPYWHRPYYAGWYGPGWYGPGWYGPGYYPGYYPHCYPGYYGPHYGYVPARPAYRYNDRRSEVGRPVRGSHSRPVYANGSSGGSSGNRVVVDRNGRTGGRVSSSGRVVSGTRGNVSSVRDHSNMGTGGRHSGSSLNKNGYTRPARTDRNGAYSGGNSSYRNSGAYNRMNRGSGSNRSSSYNRGGSSYNRNSGNSHYNRSGSGSSVSRNRSNSYSSGSSTTTVGRSGGGARRR